MDFDINTLLAAVGGITGAAFIIYMVVMVYYTRKRAADIESVRREIAELRGLLMGRRRT